MLGGAIVGYYSGKMADKLGIINVDEWIEENESSFLPPVCNKLMYVQ